MTQARDAVMENFGQANIDDIRESLSRHKTTDNEPRKAFTMVRTTSGTDVKITPESREACGKAIIR